MNFKKEAKVTLTLDVSPEHYYSLYDFFQKKNKEKNEFKLEGNKFIFLVNDLEQEMFEEISTIIANGDRLNYSEIYNKLIPDEWEIPTYFVLDLKIDEGIKE